MAIGWSYSSKPCCFKHKDSKEGSYRMNPLADYSTYKWVGLLLTKNYNNMSYEKASYFLFNFNLFASGWRLDSLITLSRASMWPSNRPSAGIFPPRISSREVKLPLSDPDEEKAGLATRSSRSPTRSEGGIRRRFQIYLYMNGFNDFFRGQIRAKMWAIKDMSYRGYELSKTHCFSRQDRNAFYWPLMG